MKNYDHEYKKIGLNIKKYRLQANLTQEELCEKVGISISYLSKIEAPNCNKRFSLDLLYRICDVLTIDIKKLFE